MRRSATEAPLTFKPQGEAKAREWRDDCRVFARDVCKVEGDKWQDLFWAAVSGPHLDPTALRMLALKACKGPGKSFALAVVGWWWLFTRWHANGIALSITADNLRDNLWAEIARVQERAELLRAFFIQRGERIVSKEHEKTWWLSARSFPQNADKAQQANTLAGLHGRHPIVLADEAGDYPDGVIVAAEAVLSTLVNGKPPDGRVIIAGNPTSTEGPLYRATKRDRKNWWVYEITSDPKDPNRTPRVDPVWAQDQIDKWGEDSDFVKINILGQFPSQSANKLIGPETLNDAAARKIDYSFQEEALIFGLDVARYGDNASVLYQRQGNMSWKPTVWRELDTMTLADRVANEWLVKQPDAVFVDSGGIGGGVVDRLRQLGVPVISIDFGSAPIETKFSDRRSEMYWKLAEWLKKGGCIHDDMQLRAELGAPNFAYKIVGKTTKFKLESKDEMKKRGIASPDMADALALTFAAPVMSTRKRREPSVHGLDNYYPVGNQWQGKIRGGTEDDWNPLVGG